MDSSLDIPFLEYLEAPSTPFFLHSTTTREQVQPDSPIMRASEKSEISILNLLQHWWRVTNSQRTKPCSLPAGTSVPFHTRVHTWQVLKGQLLLPLATAEHSFRKSCLCTGKNHRRKPVKGVFSRTDKLKSPNTAKEHFQECLVLISVSSYFSHGNFQHSPACQEPSFSRAVCLSEPVSSCKS